MRGAGGGLRLEVGSPDYQLLADWIAAGAPGPKIGNFIVEFATPGIGHILKAAGLDFAFLDMEHSGFSFETLKSAVRYFEAAQVPLIVRVPAQENDMLARACDMGAEGLIAPMISTRAQAQAMVGARLNRTYAPPCRRYTMATARL